jgi:hypothetical protein
MEVQSLTGAVPFSGKNTVTRDPARIDRILADLGRYWRANPDLRLGQIVAFAVSNAGMHEQRERNAVVFNASDDIIEADLRDRVASLPQPPPDPGSMTRDKVHVLIDAYGWTEQQVQEYEGTEGAREAESQRDRDAARTALVDAIDASLLAVCEAPVTDDEAHAVVQRLGIDVPTWAAEVRARTAAAKTDTPSMTTALMRRLERQLQASERRVAALRRRELTLCELANTLISSVETTYMLFTPEQRREDHLMEPAEARRQLAEWRAILSSPTSP